MHGLLFYWMSFFIIILSFLNSGLVHAEENCDVIAQKLNARFFSPLECSASEPNYTCAGIVLGQFNLPSNKINPKTWIVDSEGSCPNGLNGETPWCPETNTNKPKSFSFSYLQNQITPDYGYPISPNDKGTAGFILNPAGISNFYLCSYPISGESSSRANCGCGKWGSFECKITGEEPFSCDSRGIQSANDFHNIYITEPDWDRWKMCSFGGSKEQFNAMNETSILIANPRNPDQNFNPICYSQSTPSCFTPNEVILKPWYGIKIKNLPIEAFFYVTDYQDMYPKENEAKNNAFLAARYFPKQIPVVGIDVSKIHQGTTEGPFFCEKQARYSGESDANNSELRQEKKNNQLMHQSGIKIEDLAKESNDLMDYHKGKILPNNGEIVPMAIKQNNQLIQQQKAFEIIGLEMEQTTFPEAGQPFPQGYPNSNYFNDNLQIKRTFYKNPANLEHLMNYDKWKKEKESFNFIPGYLNQSTIGRKSEGQIDFQFEGTMYIFIESNNMDGKK